MPWWHLQRKVCQRSKELCQQILSFDSVVQRLVHDWAIPSSYPKCRVKNWLLCCILKSKGYIIIYFGKSIKITHKRKRKTLLLQESVCQCEISDNLIKEIQSPFPMLQLEMEQYLTSGCDRNCFNWCYFSLFGFTAYWYAFPLPGVMLKNRLHSIRVPTPSSKEQM